MPSSNDPCPQGGPPPAADGSAAALEENEQGFAALLTDLTAAKDVISTATTIALQIGIAAIICKLFMISADSFDQPVSICATFDSNL